jgi:hypothetical protein
MGTNYICIKNHLMSRLKMIAAQNPIVFSSSGEPILKKTGNPPIPDSGQYSILGHADSL